MFFQAWVEVHVLHDGNVCENLDSIQPLIVYNFSQSYSSSK